MGGLSSVVSGIDQVASVVGTASSLANNINNLSGNADREKAKSLKSQQDLALAQLKATQAASLQSATRQAALDKAAIAAQAQSAADSQELALKRAVARQRAAYGAQGLSSGDGSSQAVLLGLFDESDDEAQDRQQIDTLRTVALNQNLATRKSGDILQLSQLKQRQKLDRELASKSSVF